MSTQPRKERKSLYNLPVHKARAQIASHFDEILIRKYKSRSTTLRKGDTVRIIRGEFAGTTGKVLDIDTRARKVTVDGVTVTKADSTQKPRPIDASNLVITKLDLTDPKRREKLGATEADIDRSEPATSPKKPKKAKTEETEEAA